MMQRVAKSIEYRIRNAWSFVEYFRTINKFNPNADLILLFHGIDATGSQRYNIRFTSCSDFLFIVNALRTRYRISRLEELATPSTFPRLVLTLDDGYKNWRTRLLPVLAQHRIPVTLFICRPETSILWTDQYDIYRHHYSDPLVVAGRTFARVSGRYRTDDGLDLNIFLKGSGHDRIREFQVKAKIAAPILHKTRDYWELLNDDDIRCLGRSEWVTIGSHGCSHTSLNQLNDADLKRELMHSKQELSSVASNMVTSLSFPSGRYDDRVVKFSRAQGYKFLLAERANHEVDNKMSGDLFERRGVYTIGNKYTQVVKLLREL